MTGLPVPRFVSLAAEVANVRLGPRRSDEVIAVYRRRGLPFRVVDEEDNWRKVEDFEGDIGWIHTSLLSGRRTVIVLAPSVLRRAPTADAPAIAEVQDGVVGELLSCRQIWCLVDVGERRGWLARAGLWGVDP